MNEFSWQALSPALPEIFLAIAGMVLLIAGVVRGNDGLRTISWGVIGSFALAAMFLLGLDWERSVIFNGMFVLDRFAGFMKLFVLVGLMATIAISIRYLQQEKLVRFEYPIYGCIL